MKQAVATMKNIDRVSHIVFWFLMLSIIAMSFVYAYFIQKTIRNVVARDEIHTQISSLNSKLSSAEFQYINSVEGVTMNSAALLGFYAADASHTTFITRDAIGKNVALR